MLFYIAGIKRVIMIPNVLASRFELAGIRQRALEESCKNQRELFQITEHRSVRISKHFIRFSLYIELAEVPGVARLLNEPFRNNKIMHRYHRAPWSSG